MQRIMVDLPEPDGPQMTMRSRRSTARLMSRSTWNSPYHLCMPTISTASAPFVLVAAAASLMITSRWLASVALGKPRLDAFGVARHAVAEDEIEHGGERVSGRTRRRRRPFRIDARDFDRAQEIEDADDHDQCRVLEQADVGIDDVRNGNL